MIGHLVQCLKLSFETKTIEFETSNRNVHFLKLTFQEHRPQGTGFFISKYPSDLSYLKMLDKIL